MELNVSIHSHIYYWRSPPARYVPALKKHGKAKKNNLKGHKKGLGGQLQISEMVCL